jgi:hypothetical protein
MEVAALVAVQLTALVAQLPITALFVKLVSSSHSLAIKQAA